jgi:prepilin-type N-terminal cleavage/methylation domain-containing protein
MRRERSGFTRLRPAGFGVVSPPRPRRGGFTLVEVLVALVISATAIILIAQGFSVGAGASSNARQATRAAMLAEMKMSEFESGEQSLTSSTPGDFRDLGHPEYKWEATIDPDSFGTSRVTVTVTWQGRGGEQSFSLVRILTERTVPE